MGVPLGHRYRVSSREDIIPQERITKRAVDEIIAKGEFECTYQKGISSPFKNYEGSHEELSKILHDGKTKVKVAGSRTIGYRMGYDTVVMTAPSIDATFLIRWRLDF